MADHWNDRAVYYVVRGTNSQSNEQTAFKCAGMAAAQAKVAELRMSGCRDVVMSVSDPGNGSATEDQASLSLG